MIKDAIGGVFIEGDDATMEIEHEVARYDWTDGDALREGVGIRFSRYMSRDCRRVEESIDGIGSLDGVVGEDVADAVMGVFIVVGIMPMVVVVMMVVEFVNGCVGRSEEGEVGGGVVEEVCEVWVVADEVGEEGSVGVGEDEVVEGLVGCGVAEVWGWRGTAEGRSEVRDLLDVVMETVTGAVVEGVVHDGGPDVGCEVIEGCCEGGGYAID